jgi:Family of unknown function (DUF5946)
MLQSTNTIRCIGCAALVPDIAGPTHRYMESSPGCWAIYGEVLAREYSNPAYGIMHRLTVDAYAVQHPGKRSSQSIQSVAIHLLRLYLILERGYTDASAAKAMPILARHKGSFYWMDPPPSLGDETVLHVRSAKDPTAYEQAVWEWARSAWQAWAPHHEQIRLWLPNGL